MHHVLGFTHTFTPGMYRVTGRYLPGRFAWTTDFPVTLKMIGVTPPALMALQFSFRPSVMATTSPEVELTATIIDCGGSENFLGTSHWYSCLDVAYRTFNRHTFKALKWAHLINLDNPSDSIGMYVPPFAG